MIIDRQQASANVSVINSQTSRTIKARFIGNLNVYRLVLCLILVYMGVERKYETEFGSAIQRLDHSCWSGEGVAESYYSSYVGLRLQFKL